MSAPSDFVPLTALTGARKRYWRTLEDYEGTIATVEEPQAVDQEPPSEESRRRFLKLMAGSLAFGGLAACTRQPTEFIVPYVDPPEKVIPGRPQFYATAVPVNGVAQGVIVESHLGRPTKVEGNPDHPASLGASDVLSQASVMDLYDPDRAREIIFRNDARTWENFLSDLYAALEPARSGKGAGFRILTETITSPSLGDRMQAVLAALPGSVARAQVQKVVAERRRLGIAVRVRVRHTV